MSKMILNRKGEQQTHEGIWTGVIAFQAPWAHPIWKEYLLLLYDLTSPAPAGHETMFLDPRATHEFILYAVDPDTPINYDTSLLDQKDVRPLTPPNCGYQFTASSNDAAWDRVNELVDACFRQVTPGVFALNPDTDYRSQWDSRMRDGWSLKSDAANGLVTDKKPD